MIRKGGRGREGRKKRVSEERNACKMTMTWRERDGRKEGGREGGMEGRNQQQQRTQLNGMEKEGRREEGRKGRLAPLA